MPVPDPANPIDLNEAALAYAAQGEIETAWLLLERAALLAPADARIAANLAAVRGYRGAARRGGIVVVPAHGASPQRSPPRPEHAPTTPPPPLWPAGGSDPAPRRP
jgi:hypothetical protein